MNSLSRPTNKLSFIPICYAFYLAWYRGIKVNVRLNCYSSKFYTVTDRVNNKYFILNFILVSYF